MVKGQHHGRGLVVEGRRRQAEQQFTNTIYGVDQVRIQQIYRREEMIGVCELFKQMYPHMHTMQISTLMQMGEWQHRTRREWNDLFWSDLDLALRRQEEQPLTI